MNKFRLGDYVTIKTGKLDANAADENGLYPFFTCAERALRINIPAYDCECVLVAGNGDLNVKYYSGKFNAYQRTYIIETKDSDSLTVPYLYRFLDYYVETLRNQSIGGVIKYIKLGNLTEASIPLFEIDEQHNIINLLDCLDAIINKMQQQLFDYDNLIKSRFIEMFEHDSLPATPIEKITLSKMPNARKAFGATDLIKYIDISSIDSISCEVARTTEYLLKDAPSRAQQCVSKGDLLVSTVRPNLKNIALVNLSDENLVASTGFCVLRCKECPPEYLKTIVRSERFTHDMCQLTTGANYPAIKNSDILKYQIPLPSKEDMDQFATFVRQVDKLRFETQQQIEKLETLKKSLMQEYFG